MKMGARMSFRGSIFFMHDNKPHTAVLGNDDAFTSTQ